MTTPTAPSRWRTAAGFLVAILLPLVPVVWPVRDSRTPLTFLAELPVLLFVMTPLPAFLAGRVARSHYILVGLTWSTSLTIVWAAENYLFFAAHNGLNLWWQSLWGYGIVWGFLSLQSLCASIPLTLADRKRGDVTC
jgi:hypothetical protein